ncbi:MAG: GltB/FmdC/FwdC-like GXGXG domain-containing protein [Methanotrichaceae archaeon]
MIEIEASGEDCLCDFTFDFYWQHQGTRLDPHQKVGGSSYNDMVDGLKRGDAVLIRGDVGGRLGSSLGVDLVKLGGEGGPIEGTGYIIVDGDVGRRLGISMLRGAVYVSGEVASPVGNIVEVETDKTGYKKYVSVTEVLERGGSILQPNHLDEGNLFLADGLVRETLAARNVADKTVRVKGDAGMSAGILMRSGSLAVRGNAGRNTGVLMRGGRLVVRGICEDFTGTEMRGGEIFVQGDAGGYICPRMKGGAIFARDGKPVPPARAHTLKGDEAGLVARMLGINNIQAMMYRRFSL